MATVTLGNIKFNWKGAYNSSTAYVVDDVVSLSGSSYVCIQAGTNQNPSTATAYWEQMSSAGTNGTDLSTTLTTQGDIVYRDASGLARLGAGTSGQVLQTGGTGANPSWGTVSSDFVKLAGVDYSGSTATEVDFTQFMDDSVYASYMIRGYFLFGTASQAIRARFLNNTTAYTGVTDYYHAGTQTYRTESHNIGSTAGASVDANGRDYAQMYGWGASGNTDSFFTFNIFGKPTTSGRHTGFLAEGWVKDSSADPYIFYDAIGGYLNNTGNVDGVKLYSSSGAQLNNFQATVWGLKK